MTEETNYVHEDVNKTPTNNFFAKRWVKITGVSLIAAVALVGAFGAGVVAGERLGGGNQAFGDDHGFSQQFGGGTQKFGGQLPGGQLPGGQLPAGPKGFPGGCPANDPDHCAGTDRGQRDFKLPNNGGANSGNSSTGTTNP